MSLTQYSFVAGAAQFVMQSVHEQSLLQVFEQESATFVESFTLSESYSTSLLLLQKSLYVSEQEQHLRNIARLLKTNTDQVQEKVHQLLSHNRGLEKELEQLKAKLASSQGSDLAGQAVDVSGTKVLSAHLEGADAKTLRTTLDQLKNKLGTAAVVLASVKGDKITLVAGVTSDRTQQISAGKLVNMVAQQVGGKGGGRPDMAQAGGSQPENLDNALASVYDWARAQITN